MQKKNYSYLALGDSYTIGEGLQQQDNFPSQALYLLKNKGYSIEPLRIVAKTGWTTGDLKDGVMNNITSGERYDIVTLLIGVNNQYQDRALAEYSVQFEELLKMAITFAGNKPSQVFVLSIPDWGVTPFGKSHDPEKIAKEIDSFNVINKTISTNLMVTYIDITRSTREAANDPSLISSDHLHPSAKEYHRWAEKLAIAIQQQVR